MGFKHTVTVRFNEVDRAGIAFFSRVFEYCHAAFEEMLMATPDRLSSILESGGWAMPLVHSEADFSAPMRLGDRLTVELTVGSVGTSSITFLYTVKGPDKGVRATAKLVHAIVDLKTFTPCGVPEQLRTNLQGLGLLSN